MHILTSNIVVLCCVDSRIGEMEKGVVLSRSDMTLKGSNPSI